MPQLTKAKYEKIRLAGQRMSNLCFNLSQNEAIPADYRKTMKECYLEWDDALHKEVPAVELDGTECKR